MTGTTFYRWIWRHEETTYLASGWEVVCPHPLWGHNTLLVRRPA